MLCCVVLSYVCVCVGVGVVYCCVVSFHGVVSCVLCCVVLCCVVPCRVKFKYDMLSCICVVVGVDVFVVWPCVFCCGMCCGECCCCVVLCHFVMCCGCGCVVFW